MSAPPQDPRLDRVTEVLVDLVRLSGLSRIELARRLGSDYPFQRVTERYKEIRLRQLFQFADALEVKPLEIFRLAFAGDDQPSPLLRRLREHSNKLDGVLSVLGTSTTDPPPDRSGAQQPRSPAKSRRKPRRRSDPIADE